MSDTGTTPGRRTWSRKLFFQLGFLDSPKGSDRRQSTRQPCSFPVNIRVGAGDRERSLTATARDLSLGGMLVEGADIPEGTIRVRLSFDIPPDVLKGEDIVRSVQTSAGVRYRDQKNKTVSLSFSEPLQPAQNHNGEAGQRLMLLVLMLILILYPVALIFPDLAKYIAVCAVAFGSTLVLTPMVRAIATRFGVVDYPDERRAHSTPTPRAGGVAVVIGFFLAAIVAFLFPWEWSAGSLNEHWFRHFAIASGILVLVGLADDVKGLRPLVKLSGQLVAATIMFASGNAMGMLLGFDLPLPLDFALTLLWFAALTNAFNLIDGLDGLCIGLALVAGIGLMGAFFIRRMPSDAMVMIGLAGACLAFLRYNFHPASIFLGDTGSMFLGFTFASIALATGSKGAFLASMGVPLLAVGIPVFDTILAIWRRSVRAFAAAGDGTTSRKSGIMQPDAEHLHHRLKRRGLQQHQVAVVLYIVNAALVLTGLLSLIFRDQALGIFLVAFVAGAYVIVRHLAEVELWDTGQAIIRGLRRPQRKVAAFFFYPIFDAVCLVAATGIAVAVVHLVAPWPKAWESWIEAMPVWAAPVFLIFCATRIYSRVWSLARTNDYLTIVVSLLTSVCISTGLSILLQPDLWRRFVVFALVFAGMAHLLLLGSRLFVRGIADALALWNEAQYYKRGGVVHRVLLYGSGGRCLLYLRERSTSTIDSPTHRMIVGLVDDDPNLRFRRVGGYVVLGAGRDLPELIVKHRIDEIVITAELQEQAYRALVTLCACASIHLSEWHYEERAINTTDLERAVAPREDFHAASL